MNILCSNKKNEIIINELIGNIREWDVKFMQDRRRQNWEVNYTV